MALLHEIRKKLVKHSNLGSPMDEQSKPLPAFAQLMATPAFKKRDLPDDMSLWLVLKI